jgi:hypothetical protein
MRRGIAKDDEDDIAELADDEPIVATDYVGDAVPKGADGLAPVFEIYAGGARRLADQLAGHRGDLPALRGSVRRWCKVRRAADLQRLYDAKL